MAGSRRPFSITWFAYLTLKLTTTDLHATAQKPGELNEVRLSLAYIF